MNEEKKHCCKCNFTEEVKKSSVSVWLFAICGFLFGIIVGIFFAPIKKGVRIGCNNSALTNGNDSKINMHPDDYQDYGFDDDDELEF